MKLNVRAIEGKHTFSWMGKIMKKNIYLMCQLMISAKKEKMNESKRIETEGARGVVV